MRHKNALVLSSVLIGFAGCSRAQALTDQPSLTLDSAVKMVNACESMAKAKNWKVAIWVVDETGIAVHVKRMEGAPARAIHEAQLKSETSQRWGASTDPSDRDSPISKMLKEPQAQANAVLLNTLPEGGGLPVMANGKVVGAIGVAGAGSSADAQCAREAVGALRK